MEQRPGLRLWKRTLLQLLQQLATVSGSGMIKWRPPAEQTVTICSSKWFSGGGWNPQKHWKVEGWNFPGGVWQKGPGPKPTPNKQIYWQTSQGLNSQDPELLSGSNRMSGPRYHDRGWDPRCTEGSGCGWGELNDTEEGGEGDPGCFLHNTSIFSSLLIAYFYLGVFRSSTQDDWIKCAFFWRTWISIDRNSGFLWEVKDGIGQVPCKSAKCSSETDRGSADPPKTASMGSAIPHKMASKGSAAPSKSAFGGSHRTLRCH